jgi:hypothetical protein
MRVSRRFEDLDGTLRKSGYLPMQKQEKAIYYVDSKGFL